MYLLLQQLHARILTESVLTSTYTLATAYTGIYSTLSTVSVADQIPDYTWYLRLARQDSGGVPSSEQTMHFYY